ncbi:MAG TPA: tyrosine--tRNA ligase [Solirubrobacteraceae bacterium]|nr:tyrosine--tRNA ligase [Solirubrobacteraceae bacterium]
MTQSPAAQAAHLARDAVDCLPAGALERKLAEGRPLRVKLGLDPTAPDVHLGHTVVLRKLREFQDLGHVVVLIIGDYTARVGDPSGRSSTRPVLSGEEIDANARTYVEQAAKVLDPDRIELRHNSEWLDMPMEQLFALTRTTTVAQLLERDDFAKRYAAREPISILELLYPLMQGYDSVAVRSDVELGGTDQKFNLLLARDIQRAYGVPEQVALTMPILPGVDGERKMSKSLGNHIGVGESPQEIYGKTLSVPDDAMAGWYSLLLGEGTPADLSARDAKHALARRLVERFHSAADAGAAAEHFDRVFVRHGLPEEIEDFAFTVSDGLVHLPAVIAEAVGRTRSDARRMLSQGAVKLDGEPLGSGDLDLEPERLDGAILQVGKREFRRLRRAD